MTSHKLTLRRKELLELLETVGPLPVQGMPAHTVRVLSACLRAGYAELHFFTPDEALERGEDPEEVEKARRNDTVFVPYPARWKISEAGLAALRDNRQKAAA